MKALLIVAIVLFASCNSESSPEGRSKLRDQAIQSQIDSLKSQNKAMADSLSYITKELRELQHK